MIEAKDLQSPAHAAYNFRAILDAFAKPGRPVALAPLTGCPPKFHAASAGIALSLCDYQTAIWLSPGIDSAELRTFLRFHTGVPIVSKASEADFAFMEAAELAQFYSHFSKGTDEYPDRSATLIAQTTAFEATQKVKLEGPGIERNVVVSADGLGAREWSLLADDRILFPLGVDVAFSNESSLFAVPRSTRITCLENR